MEKCPYAKKCSGCQLTNLGYKEQLKFKQVKCISLLGRYCHVDEIVGMEVPYNYRNKSQTAVFSRNGIIKKGIYQSAEGKIVPVENCFLESEISNKITKTVCSMLKNFKIKPYDIKTNTGFLRNILIRHNFTKSEIMVVLVTTEGNFKSKTAFVNELLRRHKEITTIVWNVNSGKIPITAGKQREILFGNGYITDTLCGLDFKISSESFYQINHIQTEKLYELAKKYADLKGKERVIDAYCGTGTIGLTVASNAKKVIGVEVNEKAVADAKQNAVLNKIDNAEFINKDAGEFMSELAEKGTVVDVCITDPPRAGCSIKFLKSLILLNPKKIVYISCNPETLARDLNILTENGYEVKKITPVDMFPHTRHCEAVCKLLHSDIRKR